MFHRAREKSELILCKNFHLIRSWESFLCGYSNTVLHTISSPNCLWNTKYPSPIFKDQTIFPQNSIIVSLTFNISDQHNWKKKNSELYHSQARWPWNSSCKIRMICLCTKSSELQDEIKNYVNMLINIKAMFKYGLLFKWQWLLTLQHWLDHV